MNLPRESPIPKVDVGKLQPRRKVKSVETAPEISEKLDAINVFTGDWKKVKHSMAALICRLSDADTEFLCANLKKLDTPPPVTPELAEKWFEAISTLPSEAIVSAVNGFIYLAWAWVRMGVLTGLELEELLSLFYYAVETIAETPEGMKTTIPDLVNTGIANPERFANILSKTRYAGVDIIPALHLAEELQADAPKHAKKTLIDFAVENGWYLLEDEYQPIWKTVQKSGEAFFSRIRQMNIQPNQFAILAGFLGALEEEKKLQELLDSSVYTLSQTLTDTLTREEFEKVRDKLSEKTLNVLSNKAEQNIFLDILGLKSTGVAAKNTGRMIAEIMLKIGKGNADYSGLTALLGILSEKIDGRILSALRELLVQQSETETLEQLETASIHKLVTVVCEFLTGEDGYSAGKVHSLQKLINNIFISEDIEGNIKALYESIDNYDGDSGIILSVSALLIRSSEGISLKTVFRKNTHFARLLLLLTPGERENLFRGEKQDWVTALASEHSDNIELVIQAVSQLRNADIRIRFLKKIISPLIAESGMNSSVFEEILTPAVVSYNKEMTSEKRRNEETRLLRKLFRAEDRTRALDVGMKRILDLPGLEGDEAKSLLYIARYLCENLSQQSAWLEHEGNVLFDKFLKNSLQQLVLAFIEYPKVTTALAEGTFKKIFKTIIPQKQTEDHQSALWQLKTATYFFGEIVPPAIQHIGSSPELLSEYLEKIAERTVKADKGKPAGIEFLSYADKLLQNDMIKEMVTHIQTDASAEVERRKHTLSEVIYRGWQMIKEQSFGMQEDLVQVLETLSTDKEQRKLIKHEAAKIAGGLSRSGYIEIFDDIYTDGDDIASLRKITAHKNLLQIFREQEGQVVTTQTDEDLKEYFENYATPSGQNACKHWRENNFSLIENIIIDILLLDNGDRLLDGIDGILDDYFEVLGYLGYEADYSPYNTVAVLEKALSSGRRDNMDETIKAIEKVLDKNLYKIMWKHRASVRISEMTDGRPKAKKLTKALLDRTTSISSHKEKILFLKNFGEVFIGIEDIILGYKKKEIKNIRNDLQQLWLFDPVDTPLKSPADNVRYSINTCKQYFQEASTGSGEVSESKAVSISRGMHKQYSDNALTIAILLRWSVDSQKEELLSVLEKNPLLLETISRNTELVNLIDKSWVDTQAREIIHTFAENPVEMQNSLIEYRDKTQKSSL